MTPHNRLSYAKLSSDVHNRGSNHMSQQNDADDTLLTPAEVAALFRVSPKTVTRWARSGKLTALRTLGGHRRFRSSEVRELLSRFEHESHRSG